MSKALTMKLLIYTQSQEIRLLTYNSSYEWLKNRILTGKGRMSTPWSTAWPKVSPAAAPWGYKQPDPCTTIIMKRV